VSVIAGRSNSIVATVGVGDDPCGIAVDPLRDTVFVSNGPYNSISVINGRTNRVTATISGLSNCLAFTIDPLQGTVYVAGAGPTIAAIDEDTLWVKGTIHLGPPASKGVNGLATDALSRTLYAVTNVPKTATRSLGKLVAIDERTNTIMGSVRVGNFPAGVATNPITHLVYVANEGDDSVSVVEGP
jgi:YVTN family beta-propeller protein